jgi:AhpD family alkylhydroperoxidase
MSQRLNYVHHARNSFRALDAVRVQVGKSNLPLRLLDLVYLRVSQINGCAYCIAVHSRDLSKAGMTVDSLLLVPVWREAGGLFSDVERAALAWAETVTRVADTGVPQADFDAARAVFDEADLAELTIAIGLMNAFNRIAISFQTPPPAIGAPQS